MKATGIVRKIDELGRIVLPKELRDNLGIEEGTPLEIFVDGEFIMIRKYAPGCIFCGEETSSEYQGKKVCESCRADLNYPAL